MFCQCSNLTGLDVSHFDTSKVTDMSYMFDNCLSLKSLDVSNFDTQKVNDMYYMFYNCLSLTSLNLSSFTFTSSTKTTSLLENCKALQTLTLPATANNITLYNSDPCSGVGTASNPCILYLPDGVTLNDDDVTQGDGYFQWKGGYFKDINTKEAYFSEELELDDDEYVERTTVTFYYDNLRSIRDNTYLLPQNGGKLSIIDGMLTDIVFDSSFADYRPTNTSHWFEGLGGNDIKFTGMENLNTSEVRDMSYMFYGINGWWGLSLDLSHFDVSKVTNMSYMLSEIKFGQDDETIKTDLSSFDFNSSVNTTGLLKNSTFNRLTVPASANDLASDAFDGLGSAYRPCMLFHPDSFTPKGAEQYNGYFTWKGGYFKDINTKEAYFSEELELDDDAYVERTTVTFYYDDLRSIRDNTYLLPQNGGKLSIIDGMLTDIVFDSSFADYRPTNTSHWFEGLGGNDIKFTGMENLNTSEVRDMSYMFYGINGWWGLSLDLSHFDVSKVTNMSYMLSEIKFGQDDETIKTDLSSFDFNSSVNTTGLLKNSTFNRLTVSASASNLQDGACFGVGTAEKPCVLIYPVSMPMDRDNYEDYFVWKGGYFKEADVLPGDANGDGMVSVADVMLTVNKVMNKQLTVFIERNADVNNDGKITVADVMAIVKMVLNSGPKSAPRNAWQSMSDAMEVTAKGSELTLHLTGTGTYTASQMTLSLPEDCRLESARMVSSRSNGHSVQTSDLGNGQYRVVVYSATGLPFGNSCTDLVRLSVSGNHHGDVALSDIQVVDYHTNTVLLSDVSGLATGIESISNDTTDDGDWYTTQGQRVSTPTRGIYIRNGQKKVIRN